MAKTGEAKVGCGSYNYVVDADGRSCAVDPSLLQEGKKLVTFDNDKAEKAIKEFCEGDFQVFPNVTQPPSGFSIDGNIGCHEPPKGDAAHDQWETQCAGMDFDYPYQMYRWPEESTDHITAIFVVFTTDPGPRCRPSKEFKISDYKDQCKKLLAQVLADPDPCELLMSIDSPEVFITDRRNTRSGQRPWRLRHGAGSRAWMCELADVPVQHGMREAT